MRVRTQHVSDEGDGKPTRRPRRSGSGASIGRPGPLLRLHLLLSVGVISIGLLAGGSTAFLLPSPPPSTPPSTAPAAAPPASAPKQQAPSSTPWRLPPIPASSLQLLAIWALGPLAALVSAPPPPAYAALDLATVSKLQDEAFKATNRFNWPEAEKAWSKVLDLDPQNAAAYSNRGNTRTSMGKCVEAVEDFDKAIELAPKEPDPNLGRGVARECLGKFAEAIEDYEVANKKNLALTGVEDPVTYNNRANAEAGLGNYDQALKDYRQAAKMQPGYVFPLASAALMLYQLGQDAEAQKQMRLLLVKYPELVDMRAALAVLYWKRGDFAKAEGEWYEVVNTDPRYRRLEWVRTIRRWPPRMVQELDNFLKLKLPGGDVKQ